MLKTLTYFYILLLAGCAQMGKMDYTTFEPVTNNGLQNEFKYVVKSNIFNPADDESSEIERFQWLGMWLSDNKMCPNGYVILSRTAIDLGYSDAVKRIYYIGKCK
jgi:hypothetical protein